MRSLNSPASASWSALVFALIGLQSIVIPGTNVSSVFLLGTFFFGANLWYRPSSVNRNRLSLFLISVTALCVAAFFSSAGGGAASVGSLALLFGHYWWFVLEIPDAVDNSRLAAIRAVVVLCAVLGIAQFVVQPVAGYHTFIDLLPESLRIEGFNTSYEIYQGAALKKANGYFFLEPSVFSQFLAIGILVEVLVFRRRGLALALMLLAMLLSFSGTGIMLLLVSGLVAAARDRRLLLDVASFGLLVIIAIAIYATIDLDGLQRAFLARFVEFNQPGTSGHARFVAPMSYALAEMNDWHKALFGVGPGMATILIDDAFAAFSLVPKLLMEYGFVGGVPLLVLMLVRLSGWYIPVWYKTMLIVFYWLLGGNLLAPVIILAVLLFHASVPRSMWHEAEGVAPAAAK